MSFVRGIRKLLAGNAREAAREFTGAADQERERQYLIREQEELQRQERIAREREQKLYRGGGSFFPVEQPTYHIDTNNWDGISDTVWREMQRIMNHQIRDGASYNFDQRNIHWIDEEVRRSLTPDDRQHDFIDAYEPNQRYGAIITAIEQGLMTPEQMLQFLRDTDRIMRQVAQGDDGAAKRRWENRDTNLPDELFYYHWGF